MTEIPHLAWPLQLAPDGSLQAVEQDTVDEVRQCVHVLLHTPPGARPLAPETGVEDLAFTAIDPDELAAALQDQEPRATVTVAAEPADPTGEQVITVQVALSDPSDEPDDQDATT